MATEAGTDLVFVAADPPRASCFAYYPVPAGAAGSHLDIVVPAGRGVRRRQVPARTVPIAEMVDELARRPIDGTTSTDAWATATRLALELVGRGRLQPGITSAGIDTWRVGPLAPDDQRRIAALAAAFPPSAHALAVGGASPLRIRDPASLLGDYLDAVADVMVRSAAAGQVVSQPSYAATGAQDASGLEAWLGEVAAPVAGTAARPSLRLELPEGADGAFTAVLQLGSAVDPSLVIDAADLWVAPALVLARFGDGAEAELLLALRRGARIWPPLQRLLDEAKPSELVLDDEEAVELLGGVAVELAATGIDVLWPAELGVKAEVRASLGTPAPASVTGPAFTMESLLAFQWQVAVGGEVLTADELAILADAKRPLVRLRGRWVLADPDLLERLRRQPKVSAATALAAALTGSLTVAGEAVAVHLDGPLATLAERLRSIDTSTELAEPPGLDATLRPYQRRGLAWLAELSALGMGGCLADDMGLGKTVQVIALHLHQAQAGGPAGPPGPMLVVCPTTLLGNWAREIERFAPGTVVRRYHGMGRHLDDLAPGEVVLTTYGTARRDVDALAAVAWARVVADEAQHAKNPLARTAKALRTIPAPSRLALTGTPVENRLSELWSILDWSVPGLLGPLETFRRDVAVPIERDRDPEATERLVRLVRPFLLRRRKSDPEIVPDLPPKTETDRVVPLTTEQATLYEAVVRETLARISEADGIQRQGLVFQLLTGLKQICDHPALYLRQRGPYAGRSGKLEALDELVEVITAEGDAVLVFSQYVEMGRILEAHLAATGVPTLFLHGRVPARQRQAMVDRFQAGEAPVFLLSLKAGGTGLNLTRATHVIHYDRWWNPAVEDQASDRAWRIGQDRPVQVHRFLAEGTMEDRIAQVIAAKRDLADRVVGEGEAWITQLTDAELGELVRLRVGLMARRTPRRPRRTTFGSTWWGRAWVEALEHRARLDPNRLPRGRSYARWNMVSRLEMDRGEVRAMVQGSRPQPYAVRLRVRQLTDDEWATVFGAIAARAANAAALLDGELEPGVAEAAASAGADLLPGAGELQPRCSCPDWADPCKHAAAVCYLVADQLDADPFALFLLRGRDREQVMAGVRQQRAGPAGELAGVAATHLTRPPDAGVPARQAWQRAAAGQPPLPALGRPGERPPHVLTLASDPPAGLAPTAAELAALALDAARRARELLGGDGSSGLALGAPADLARRAAATFGGPEGELERLAACAGVRPRELWRLALAWRHGGPVGVQLVAAGPSWTVASETLHAGRANLVEAGVPGARVKVDADSLTLVGQRARLYPGPDGLWYRLERTSSGAELARAPSDDPADLVDVPAG